MDGMLLLRLRDCERSTRLGMVDQGFPEKMRQLAAMGYVRKIGRGHQTTPSGSAFLADPEIKVRLKRM